MAAYHARLVASQLLAHLLVHYVLLVHFHTLLQQLVRHVMLNMVNFLPLVHQVVLHVLPAFTG